MNATVLLMLALLATGCGANTSEPLQQSVQAQPEDNLAQLPAADMATIRAAIERGEWPNPRLMVHPDGIELVPNDRKNRGPHVSVAEIERALNSLPAEAWPLGRTVSVQENGVGFGQAQKANLKALVTMLESRRVLINRVPSA